MMLNDASILARQSRYMDRIIKETTEIEHRLSFSDRLGCPKAGCRKSLIYTLKE